MKADWLLLLCQIAWNRMCSMNVIFWQLVGMLVLRNYVTLPEVLLQFFYGLGQALIQKMRLF